MTKDTCKKCGKFVPLKERFWRKLDGVMEVFHAKCVAELDWKDGRKERISLWG